jgi:hypothetical protein
VRRGLVWAVLGTALLAAAYVPTTVVPIIVDDFLALFQVHSRADGSLVTAVTYGADQGTKAGHFNPVGQSLGAVYHFLLYRLSAEWGIDPQFGDLAGGFVLMWLTAVTATWVLHAALSQQRAAGRAPGFGALFAALAAVFAASLAVHAPWSFDPTVSFAMAGWGSAAAGFALLALTLRATDPRTRLLPSAVWPAVAGVLCVLVYELLAAAVAGAAVVIVLRWAQTRRELGRPALHRAAALLGGTVVLPAIVFLAGRVRTSSAIDNVPGSGEAYPGTQLLLEGRGFATWGRSLVSGLPGHTWYFVSERVPAVQISARTLALAVAMSLGIGLVIHLWRRWSMPLPARDGTLTAAMAGLVVFWVLCTGIQSMTAKNVTELKKVGQVYLFYSIALGAVSVLLLVGILLLLGRERPRTLLLWAAPLVPLFLLVQVAVNTAAAEMTLVSPNDLNRHLAALSTAPEAEESVRCRALREWGAKSKGWEDYYRDLVRQNLQDSYELVYDEPFCRAELGR